MVKQVAVQNNFIGGLKTEFTGLNFPENACTEADNVIFGITGDITRRPGINYELNHTLNNLNTSVEAVNYYRWMNAGGDGNTQILVVQVQGSLFFYLTSDATATVPISRLQLGSQVVISTFQASGNLQNVALTECQFTDGNGYLFVFHPDCDPFYCTFAGGLVTANLISVQIRDFVGVNDGLQQGQLVANRPGTLTNSHEYNLQNQGWSAGQPWTAVSSSNVNCIAIGDQSFTVASGIAGISEGQTVALQCYLAGRLVVQGSPTSFLGTGQTGAYGTVISYTGTTLVINIFNFSLLGPTFEGVIPYGGPGPIYTIVPTGTGYISTWVADEGNYPSNADQWWVFKDTNGTFDPSTTADNVTLNSGQAPQGFYILSAFNQNRTAASGVAGLTTVSTTTRPGTGCWSSGRVWYAGTDASQAASGDANFYTWTENIYFSQIITAGDVNDFGSCYQTNDPTSENFFDLLPSDGGVITIQGCGSIYRLFPIQNGIIVFAANGVWYITGSTGIGFTADDYTITKISSVQSISSTSFIDVRGYPFFWNEEDIYAVTPSQQGGLNVEPLGVGNFLSFYNNIPIQSKRFARGTYNPITYILEWVYNSAESESFSNWQYDSAICINTWNKAFYPYSISQDGVNYINGLVYMNYPGTASALEPTFKYLTSVNNLFTFSEENDETNWVDFYDTYSIGTDYISSFITGYSLAGKAVSKWQPTYLMVYSRTDTPTQYTVQGIWDYAVNNYSGRYSNNQLVQHNDTNYGMQRQRLKIRGHGEALQLNFQSVSGQPFDIMGWTLLNDVEQGV
jgi:hypothetical protein